MSKNKDTIKPWYEIINKKTGGAIGKKIPRDDAYQKHQIEPTSQICVIGATGAGKTTFCIEFLSRKQSWYEIIIFSASTVDEPIYNYLQKLNDEIRLIDNVDELPSIEDYKDDENKQNEKLIIFDDVIGLPKKAMQKIKDFYMSSRKMGFTCILLSQNYTDVPIMIRRNISCYIIFKTNNPQTIGYILKSHSGEGDDLKTVKSMYVDATKKQGDFFKIDFKQPEDKRYSHNFTDFY
jgi:hypothetical protein